MSFFIIGFFVLLLIIAIIIVSMVFVIKYYLARINGLNAELKTQIYNCQVFADRVNRLSKLLNESGKINAEVNSSNPNNLF